MKKILFIALCTSIGLGAMSADIAGPLPSGFGSAYTDISGMQSPESQLRLLEQQKFRHEEYNEFDDMKQVKEARNKKIELEQQYQQTTNKRPAYTNTNNINFVNENGKIILKQTY